LRVWGNAVGQELEGHEAAELGVLGFVNHTHPAAELFQDAVVRNGSAQHEAPPTAPELVYRTGITAKLTVQHM
jgi:hypothetical protein